MTSFPRYLPTVTFTGSEASRDGWAARAAAISSSVVAGGSGRLYFQ